MTGLIAFFFAAIASMASTRLRPNGTCKLAFSPVVLAVAFGHSPSALSLFIFGSISANDFAVTSTVDSPCWFVPPHHTVELAGDARASPLTRNYHDIQFGLPSLRFTATLSQVFMVMFPATRFADKRIGLHLNLLSGSFSSSTR